MLSKIIAVGLIAAFLVVICMPVSASDGRISNTIDEPGRYDEHPWGGDHYAPPDPEPDKVAIPDTFGDSGPLFFVHLGIHQTWLSVRNIFWNPSKHHRLNIEIKRGGQSTPMPNQNVTNDPGARNN